MHVLLFIFGLNPLFEFFYLAAKVARAFNLLWHFFETGNKEMMFEYHLPKLVKEHLVDILGLFSAENSDRFLKVFNDKLKLILLVLFVDNFFEEPLND